MTLHADLDPYIFTQDQDKEFEKVPDPADIPKKENIAVNNNLSAD